MSLVLEAGSGAGGVKVVSDVAAPPGGGASLQWDYSPKSMDGVEGPTSNGAGPGVHAPCVVADSVVIAELNGDCSTDDSACLAQTAIIKQVCLQALLPLPTA